MARFLGTPKVQYFKTGTVEYLANGKLYTWEPGTETDKATYPTMQDAADLTNANVNPIVLNARGEANVVLTGATKLKLTDEDGNEIWTVDDLGSVAGNVLDPDNNEILIYGYVPSAVNEWTITNAATGDAPSFKTTGDDGNVAGKVASKGGASLLLDGGVSGDVELNSISSGTVRARRAFVAHSTSTFTGAATFSSTTTTNGTVQNNAAVTMASSLTVNGAVSFLPAGCVSWYAGSSVPTGWLECEGSAVSRTTYAALFAVIGVSFGSGDGSTTFNLPNQARRVLVGRGGSGTATLANTIASTGGEETHVITTAEMPAHTHSYNVPASVASGSTPNAINAGTINQAATTGSTGGGAAHNNMQPSLVLMLCIRAV